MKLKADCYGRVPFRPSDLLNPDFDRAAVTSVRCSTLSPSTI